MSETSTSLPEELAQDPDERPYHPDAVLLVRAAEWVALERERDDARTMARHYLGLLERQEKDIPASAFEHARQLYPWLLEPSAEPAVGERE